MRVLAHIRFSCVSPRYSVEPGIRELICVHRAAPNCDGSAPALRFLVPHVFFFSRSGGRVSFLTAAYFVEFHKRVIAAFSVAVVIYSLLVSPSTCMGRMFWLLCVFGYRSLRFEEFRREERKFRTSSPVAAHPS